MTVIALAGVGVQVGGIPLWSDLDLQVAAGELVAVLGPNGAGKSTLIRVLLGIHPFVDGTATVLGVPPGGANARIGYLPQRRSFDPSVRVRGIDLVRLGLDGTRWGTPLPSFLRRASRRASATDAVAEAIATVGAQAYAHRPIGEISGGEQQRLLIAQALVRKPDLFLLDEPLDSLDLPNQQAVTRLLRQVCDEGTTVVIVAHDVNPILSALDQVVYIAGRRALAGRPLEVITTEHLSALYGTPIDILHTSDGRLVVVGQPEGHSFHGHT